jgi:hypothetical protein
LGRRWTWRGVCGGNRDTHPEQSDQDAGTHSSKSDMQTEKRPAIQPMLPIQFIQVLIEVQSLG